MGAEYAAKWVRDEAEEGGMEIVYLVEPTEDRRQPGAEEEVGRDSDRVGEEVEREKGEKAVKIGKGMWLPLSFSTTALVCGRVHELTIFSSFYEREQVEK